MDNFEGHYCTLKDLPKFEDLILEHRDYKLNHWLHKIRKKTQLLITVSPLLKSKRVLRSRIKKVEEAQQHISGNYWYIIHPYSLLEYYYTIFITMVYLLDLLNIPIVLMMSFEATIFTYVQLVLDVILLVHVAKNFFTGFVNLSKDQVILEPSAITKRYLGTYFFVDLMIAIPGMNFFATSLKQGTVYALIKLLIFCRSFTIKEYLYDSFTKYGIKTKYQDLVFIGVYVIIISHFITCLTLSMYAFFDPTKVEQLTPSVYLVHLKQLMVVMCNGVYVEQPGRLTDLGFYAISSLFYTINASYVTAVILNFVINEFNANVDYESMMSQLKVYLAVKRVPIRVQKQIMTYYKYKYREKHFKEDVLVSMLAANLRADLKLSWCGKVFEKMELLNNLPRYILDTIMDHLIPEIYCPNDTIIRAGARGDCMFFLITGSVTIYTANGREVCHLHDGDFFGETALVLRGQRRLASVVAIEFCEIFKLDANDFRNIAKECAVLTDRLKNIARKRKSETNLFELERIQAIKNKARETVQV